MSERCELLDSCGFFRNFTSNLEVIKAGWIRLYCEHRETSELCVRKKIRLESGQPPADNMAPTGTML